MLGPLVSGTVRWTSATALAVLSSLALLPVSARAQASSPPRHTVSVGVLGAANLAAFRVTGNATYEQRVGWASGAWLNVPMGRFFSLEPQVLFSVIPSRQTGATRTNRFLDEASVNHVSAPLLLKLHLGWIALSVGGQIDVPLSVVDDPNVWTLDDIAPFSAAATGGLELFPRSRVSLYGRYSYGFTNVDERAVPDPSNTFYNQGAQAGIRVRLFGGGRGGARPASGKKSAIVGECPVPSEADILARCPLDQDGDGLIDRVDRCPAEAGSTRFDGCPPPDTDGDGILDDTDSCPKEVGVAKYSGCAPPDKDRDGIADEEDRCPTIIGARETMGCPRITAFAGDAVTFAPGSATLTPQGRRELDKVVDYMKLYVDVRVRLSGHTDNIGGDVINNPLSEARAEAARAYLISRAIDGARITAEGHGSAQPTIGNGTPAGRAKNRRVEVIIR
jgi:outer membrane protein OmpA-like peptidoglycan-associated protein